MEESLNQLKEVVQNPKSVHPVKYALKTFHKNPKFYITSFVWSIVSTAVGVGLFLNQERILREHQAENQILAQENKTIEQSLKELRTKVEYSKVSDADYKMSQVHAVYLKMLEADEILDSLPQTAKTASLRTRLDSVVKLLAKGEVSLASSELDVIMSLAQSSNNTTKTQ
ncbi:MAG: hypothetical protein KA035_01175 [Candidatus Levybacteria bacterium]|nr:hypothetical protein [Candidatus Levybacteria bacterium]